MLAVAAAGSGDCRTLTGLQSLGGMQRRPRIDLGPLLRGAVGHGVFGSLSRAKGGGLETSLPCGLD